MSFITNPKIKIATATAGSIALLMVGSLSAAVAADSKSSSDSKEIKPACTENMRNVGTVAAPICVANGASAYEIAVKQGFQGTVVEWLASLKGAKGDQGNVGPQGIQGIQGIQGNQGNQGIQGAKGDKGDQGNTGEQGPKGDKGTTGDQGPKGDQGNVGAQGPEGAKGDTGAQGPAGAPGTNGTNGQDANVLGTACSFDTTTGGGHPSTVHHTGVWGFGQITGDKGSKIAVYGCVLAANDSANGDD